MKYVIYTKSNCPSCVRAKDWLKRQKLRFEEISLDDEELKALFKAAYPEVRSVPYVTDEHGNVTLAWKGASND